MNKDEQELQQNRKIKYSKYKKSILLVSSVFYFGMFLIFADIQNINIITIIFTYPTATIGVVIGVVALGLWMSMFIEQSSERQSDRVSYIDELRRQQEIPTKISQILKEAETLELDKINKEEIYKDFSSYFNEIKILLENKSSDADAKASILLDKGTAYSKFGIAFFIISIIGWQITFIITTFKDQHIYGIISCSLLFIFIEFLSAWFLKQYRNYVDTSTYLIKIKSIFDRYMLVYLALDDKNKNTNELINLLSDDIKWPETYLLKSGDISFAKEAFETMSYFVQQAKKEAKHKKDTE